MPNFADIERGDKIGMIQFGRGSSFPKTPINESIATNEFIRENLDGHEPIQAQLLGQMNLGHGAGAQPLNDLKTRNASVGPSYFGEGSDAVDLVLGDDLGLNQNPGQAMLFTVQLLALLLETLMYFLVRRQATSYTSHPSIELKFLDVICVMTERLDARAAHPLPMDRSTSILCDRLL